MNFFYEAGISEIKQFKYAYGLLEEVGITNQHPGKMSDIFPSAQPELAPSIDWQG